MRYRKNRDGSPPFVDPLFAKALSGFGSRDYRRRKEVHKTKMLCRQVQRAVDLALMGELGDDLLRELHVVEVLAAPDAGHLLVQVSVPANISVAEAMARLNRATLRLRILVARSITRKRAPELAFVPAPLTPEPEEDDDQQ